MKPRLPLVAYQGCFIRYSFYLIDPLGVLLPENLIGDGSGQHVAGMCQLGQRLVSSLAQSDPLAKLLIEKGLITREEFIEKLAAAISFGINAQGFFDY